MPIKLNAQIGVAFDQIEIHSEGEAITVKFWHDGAWQVSQTFVGNHVVISDLQGTITLRSES